ncbi:hypothetical protein [Okeania sp. KiyG1]|uniref:hypothetical protein n=1 Tax=Okeania sp. KiyG1 TaxID=2720165 RepID=UPI00192363C8|nr:hypothetical protein [Okeania sp. KiyG1]
MIFHWEGMDGKILRTTSIYLWMLRTMKNILSLLLGKIPENPLARLIFQELRKMKILMIFHWEGMDGKILRTTSIYLWMLRTMKNILSLLLRKILENPLTGLIFLELHKMKMLVIFHWGEMDGKILRTTSIYLWMLHTMKIFWHCSWGRFWEIL